MNDDSAFATIVFPRVVIAITAASPVIGYFSPHSILSVQRMLFLVRFAASCTCSDLAGTDVALNPTLIRIPPYSGMAFERGALASNVGLVAGFAFVVLIFAFIAFSEQGVQLDSLQANDRRTEHEDDRDEEAGRRPLRAMSLWECMGWYHFPGVLVVPLALLLQPIVRSISRLLVDHSASTWIIDVAVSCAAGLFLLAAFVHVVIMLSPSYFLGEPSLSTSQTENGASPLLARTASVVRSLRRPDEQSCSSAWLRSKGFLTPVGHWIYATSSKRLRREPTKHAKMFLRRYGKLFLHYDGGREWMLLAEVAVSVAFGIVEGVVLLGNGSQFASQNNVCAALQWFVMCLSAVRLVIELLLLPFVLWSATIVGIVLGMFELVAAVVVLATQRSSLLQWHVVPALALAHIVFVLVSVPVLAVMMRMAALNAVSATSRRVTEGSRVGGEVFDDTSEFLKHINTSQHHVQTNTTNFVVEVTKRASSRFLASSPRSPDRSGDAEMSQYIAPSLPKMQSPVERTLLDQIQRDGTI